jgi:hypothetical protein
MPRSLCAESNFSLEEKRIGNISSTICKDQRQARFIPIVESRNDHISRSRRDSSALSRGPGIPIGTPIAESRIRVESMLESCSFVRVNPLACSRRETITSGRPGTRSRLLLHRCVGPLALRMTEKCRLYSARHRLSHRRVGIAHRREPPRPKTVGDAHPTKKNESARPAQSIVIEIQIERRTWILKGPTARGRSFRLAAQYASFCASLV